MKKLLLSFFSLFFTLTVQAQYTSIPNQNFEKKLIELGHDDVLDGRVLTVDIEKVTSLSVSGSWDNKGDILDLSGIESFKKLVSLNCSSNKINYLNLSQNTLLRSLSCGDNRLTDLDISESNGLEFIFCSINKLNELDIYKKIFTKT